ncbi:MAG: FAD binding domain-containing protein [Nitrospinota bacterium]
MKNFDYVAPRTLDEAVSILKDAKEGWHVLSGGTNLVVEIRDRKTAPDVVVDISYIDSLRYIREENGKIRIGGRASVEDLLRSGPIREKAGVLYECALNFAGPPIRNRATVAGNIVDASPAADCAPPLQALDAVAVLRSAEGERRVPVSEFAQGVRETVRRPNELVTEIEFEPIGKGSGYGYYKLGRRRAMAISVVSEAVVLHMDNGTCRKAGISLGAVAPVPIRVQKAEEMLEGKPAPDETTVNECGRLAAEAASPIDDIRASAEYRKLMCEVLTRRLINRALGREA